MGRSKEYPKGSCLKGDGGKSKDSSCLLGHQKKIGIKAVCISASLQGPVCKEDGHGLSEGKAEAQKNIWEMLVPVGDGAMWWDPAFAPLLRRAGLDSFDAVMNCQTGQRLRRLPDRENWRLELVHPGGHRVGVYLKKHLPVGSESRWRWPNRTGTITPGRWEAENIHRVCAAGLQAMRVVALGERIGPDGRHASFLMTEELTGFVPLDRFVGRYFSPSAQQQAHQESSGRNRALDRLTWQVAETVQRFHRAGLNHRDLYGCHFFVRQRAEGGYEIRLIDLQRVQHRRWFRRRWLVKDLAQLAWSIPAEWVGCTQRMRFMKWYLGVEKLRPADKRLIRRVLAKQQVLLRRLGPPAEFL